MALNKSRTVSRNTCGVCGQNVSTSSQDTDWTPKKSFGKYQQCLPSCLSAMFENS